MGSRARTFVALRLAPALLLAMGWSAAGEERAAPPAPIPSLVSERAQAEHFALELSAPSAAGGRSPAALEVGVARLWRRAGEHSQFEFEARFFEEGARVHLVERTGPSSAELVWREWRAGAGRTLSARMEHGRISLVDWGREQAYRESIPAPPGVVWPLQAIELARHPLSLEAWRSAPMLVFDPLGRRIERRRLEWRTEDDRSVSVRWLDASSALTGEFRFREGVLRSFRWQGGALLARAIEAQEYERRVRDAQAREAAPVGVDR